LIAPRGIRHSVETVSLLLALKVAYPDRVHLLRGRQESIMAQYQNRFMDECMVKYDFEVFTAFATVFNAMPLAAVVNGKVLCVSSGLSQHAATINQIEDLDRSGSLIITERACAQGVASILITRPRVCRFQDVPGEGLLYDLLFNQPEDRDMPWDVSSRGDVYFNTGTHHPPVHSYSLSREL
jgi:diadenosine tetraphosphatase ApaH/serine/threonine PP2A family protein phosphatase